MKKLVLRFVKDEVGATAIEYSLIAVLISIGIITAAGLIGDQLSATFNYIAGEVKTANAK